MAKRHATEVSEPTNGGQAAIETTMPYIARIEITGSADILFHRWNCDSVEEKSRAAKGSKEKKSDNLESYVYRDDANQLCIPGEYLRGSIINAAKFRQDPRSPRKSAMDLFKAAIVPLTILAPLGSETWDYEHRCRVQVQRNGITRTRPAMKAGWVATFDMMVNLPEYIAPTVLNEVTTNAGRLIGLADFRPTFGRFQVTSFSVVRDAE